MLGLKLLGSCAPLLRYSHFPTPGGFPEEAMNDLRGNYCPLDGAVVALTRTKLIQAFGKLIRPGQIDTGFYRRTICVRVIVRCRGTLDILDALS